MLVAQLCLTLCDPTECSSVHGILQTKILEWVAIPFSKGSSQPRDWTRADYITGRFFTLWATREAQSFTRSKWNTVKGEYSFFLFCFFLLWFARKSLCEGGGEDEDIQQGYWSTVLFATPILYMLILRRPSPTVFHIDCIHLFLWVYMLVWRGRKYIRSISNVIPNSDCYYEGNKIRW